MYSGNLISGLEEMVIRAEQWANARCEYEYGEDCFREPCGSEEVVGFDLETETYRCKKHMEAQ